MKEQRNARFLILTGFSLVMLVILSFAAAFGLDIVEAPTLPFMCGLIPGSLLLWRGVYLDHKPQRTPEQPKEQYA